MPTTVLVPPRTAWVLPMPKSILKVDQNGPTHPPPTPAADRRRKPVTSLGGCAQLQCEAMGCGVLRHCVVRQGCPRCLQEAAAERRRQEKGSIWEGAERGSL